MTPPALARSRWPPRPAISDITAVNWPLFLAAAAVRLLAQDEPDLPLSDEPGTAAPAADAMEVDAAAAAPAAAAPAAAAAAAASDDDDSDDDLSLTAKVDPAKAAAEKKAAAAAAAEKARVAAAAAAAAAARRAALAPVQRAVSALLCVHPSEVLKTFAALDASCKLALLRVACEAACRASVVEGAMRAKEERREELGRRWEAEEKEERKRKREEREARRAEVRQTLEREGEVNELLVAERMRRLDQEEAVGKTTHVFTRDELAAAEGDRAMELDVAAAGVDESGNQLGAAQVAAAEARRDEMRKRLDRLGASRDAAEERLLQAVDDGKLGDGAAGAANLEAALEAARALALEGSHTADGVGPPTAARWMTAAVRDAYVALAECKTRAAGGERDHERLRELARVGGVRAEPLGVDRWGRRYWDFDGAAAPPPPPPRARAAAAMAAAVAAAAATTTRSRRSGCSRASRRWAARSSARRPTPAATAARGSTSAAPTRCARSPPRSTRAASASAPSSRPSSTASAASRRRSPRRPPRRRPSRPAPPPPPPPSGWAACRRRWRSPRPRPPPSTAARRNDRTVGVWECGAQRAERSRARGPERVRLRYPKKNHAAFVRVRFGRSSGRYTRSMKTSTPWSIGSTISGIAARPHTVGAQTDGGVVMRCEAHTMRLIVKPGIATDASVCQTSVSAASASAPSRDDDGSVRARQLASAATYVKATAYVALTAACGISGRNASPHSFA